MLCLAHLPWLERMFFYISCNRFDPFDIIPNKLYSFDIFFSRVNLRLDQYHFFDDDDDDNQSFWIKHQCFGVAAHFYSIFHSFYIEFIIRSFLASLVSPYLYHRFCDFLYRQIYEKKTIIENIESNSSTLYQPRMKFLIDNHSNIKWKPERCKHTIFSIHFQAFQKQYVTHKHSKFEKLTKNSVLFVKKSKRTSFKLLLDIQMSHKKIIIIIIA